MPQIMREQLTRKDVEKIEQEIEHRKLVVRKEAIEAVKEARAQGDLSENFEYYAAKKHKNQNESRIRYLERMLKTASIVSDNSRADEVGMDDIVEVLFEEDNEVEKYKLVTSIRGNYQNVYPILHQRLNILTLFFRISGCISKYYIYFFILGYFFCKNINKIV